MADEDAGATSASEWLCRSCACCTGVAYMYPPSPWVYCARFGCAMSPEEQLVALARIQFVTAACGAQASQPAGAETGRGAGPERPLMTVDDVAEFFGKDKGAVYKMAERGQLAGVTRVGRRLYVRRADLLRSLVEGRVPSPGRSR